MTISTDADKRQLLEALLRSPLSGLTEIEAAAVCTAFDTIADQLLFVARTGKTVRLHTLAGWTSPVELAAVTVIEESGFFAQGLLCTFASHDPAEVFPDRPFTVRASQVEGWLPTMSERDAWDTNIARMRAHVERIRQNNVTGWKRLVEVADAMDPALPMSDDDRVRFAARAAEAGLPIDSDLDLRCVAWLTGAGGGPSQVPGQTSSVQLTSVGWVV